MTANVEELGKITASKEILNDIAIAYGASRDFYRRTGCNALADRCSKIAVLFTMRWKNLVILTIDIISQSKRLD